MILGIGTDSIDINRFKKWDLYHPKMIGRIFSLEEILYAQQSAAHTAERLAVRFAAKEALVKAIRQTLDPSCPFLSLCAAASIAKHPDGRPYFIINWHTLSGISNQTKNTPPAVHISLTHSKTTASAFVILEQHT